MSKYNYLIIGGGIAGTSAAETIRKEDKESSIAIISEEPYPLYSRILLSKPSWFLGKIPAEKVWLKNDDWYQANRVILLKGVMAVSLDPDSKTVSLDRGEAFTYDKLLIATGSCARKWPVRGAEKQGVFYLRTYDDVQGIIKATKSAKNAVTIGGGFISFEMADLLRTKGIEVTNIIRETNYWQPIFDKAGADIVERAMLAGGVKFFKESLVEKVTGGDKVEGVVLEDGTEIECDMIISGIGVQCSIDWLQEAGIKTNHGIIADEFLQTNRPDIWAAGDAAEYKDVLLGESVMMGNWASAQKQGQHAALNMMGKKEPLEFVSFYTATGFGVTIAFAGDVRPLEGRDIVSRGPDGDSYARILIQDGRVVGGSMINRNQEMGLIKNLIEQVVDVSDKFEQLADPSFDLKQLLL